MKKKHSKKEVTGILYHQRGYRNNFIKINKNKKVYSVYISRGDRNNFIKINKNKKVYSVLLYLYTTFDI
jgi:hypothetical protein